MQQPWGDYPAQGGQGPPGGQAQQPMQQQQQASPYTGFAGNSNAGFGQPFGMQGGQAQFTNMAQGVEQMANLAANPMLHGWASGQVSSMANQLTPGASWLWNSLRYYLHVDNKYVVRKIKLLLFPWMHDNWARIRVGDEGSSQLRTSDFAPPVADLNAPDMYLPSMSFVTYVLFIGFLKGTKGKFNPEVLQDTGATCLFTLMFEVSVLKLTLWLLGIAQKVPWLDLVVYAGYKYVVLALGLMLGIGFGTIIYTIFLLYCASSLSFFIFRTMQNAVPKPGYSDSGHKRRRYFLFASTGLQLLAMLFLAFNRDMGESTFIRSAFSSGPSVLDDPPVKG